MTLTAEQLSMRRTGVGASEVAAVLGINPYRTPMGVWLDKVRPGPEWVPNETAALGNALEPWLLEVYRNRCLPEDHEVIEWGETVRHPDYPFALATPDGRVCWTLPGTGVAVPDAKWGVECKTCWSWDESKWWGVGGDEVPVPYYLQCQWCMAVTGLTRWDLIALIAPMRGDPAGLLSRDGGYHDPRAILRRYTLQADPELQAHMIQKVGEWWHSYVVPKMALPPTGNAKDLAIMRTLFPYDDDAILPANSDDDDWAFEYGEAQGELKEATARMNLLKAQGIKRVGGSVGLESRKFKLTYKPDKNGKRSLRVTLRGGKVAVPTMPVTSEQ